MCVPSHCVCVCLYQMEVNHVVCRDDFSCMLRDWLKLDLEPEEEEVLYRVMTVFGRIQEIKVLENDIGMQEKTRLFFTYTYPISLFFFLFLSCVLYCSACYCSVIFMFTLFFFS